MKETKKKSIRILLIAPYESLIHLFKKAVLKYEEVSLDAYECDTIDVPELIKSINVDDYDIVISRGYTCNIIRSVCDCHVWDVGNSLYDIIRVIQLALNSNSKFAVVGFSSVIGPAVTLKNTLKYDYSVREVKSIDEIDGCLKELASEGCFLIIGDVITTRIAELNNLQSLLIITGQESVDSVLAASVADFRSHMEMKKRNDFYLGLLGASNIKIVVYDSREKEVFNNLAPSDVHASQLKKAVRQKLTQVFDEGEQRFTKTIENYKYSVVGRLLPDENEKMAAFFAFCKCNAVNNNKLIQYSELDELEVSSQNPFFLAAPVFKEAQEAIQSFEVFTRPIMIIGQWGSGKDSFVRFMCRRINFPGDQIVTINCAMSNEKEWSFLLNDSNSPLFDENIIIYFRDFHYLSERQQEQLNIFINNTALNKRCQLILSYAPSLSSTIAASSGEILAQRINATIIRIPSLNMRRDDIPKLATVYLGKISAQLPLNAIAFEEDALQALQKFNWTGNLEQFHDVISKLASRSTSAFISGEETKKVLAEYTGYSAMETENTLPLPFNFRGTLQEMNREIVKEVLRDEGLNQSKAAKRLCISRSTLRRYIEES